MLEEDQLQCGHETLLNKLQLIKSGLQVIIYNMQIIFLIHQEIIKKYLL